MKEKDNNRKINLDKNVSFNIQSIRDDDRATEIIIRSLIMYISYSTLEEIYDTDLFGWKTLDPYKFAEMLELDRANLNRMHPDPQWRKFNPNEDKSAFDTYLGNALYILSTKNFIQHYRYKIGNKNVAGVKNFLFIEEIQEISTPVNNGRRNKILYQYKMDKKFEANLKQFFLVISDFRNFIKLKNINAEDFYLKIINIYHQYKWKENKYYFSFDEISESLKINAQEPKYMKKNITKKLKNIISNIEDEIPKLKFEWIKGKGQKYAYTLCMSWKEINQDQELLNGNKEVMRTFLKALRKELYIQYIMDNEKAIFNEECFFNWLVEKKNWLNINQTYEKTFKMFFQIKSNSQEICWKNTNKINEFKTIEEFREYFEV